MPDFKDSSASPYLKAQSPGKKDQKSPFSDKSPPHSLEGEQYILGSLLVGGEEVSDTLLELLKEEDFYKPAHQSIFAGIVKLYKQGSAIDILCVSEQLKKQQSLELVGGNAYLSHLVEQSTSLVSAEECARILREKALLRKVIQFCMEFRDKAFAQDFTEIDVFMDFLEKKLFQLTDTLNSQDMVSLSSIVKDNLEQLEELYHKKLSVTGVSTSFTELDHLTSGFQNGELTIIAARPSMGKTALSLNMALSAALNDKKVAFFSVEMAKEQVLKRLFALAGKVPLSHLRTGQMSSEDWDRLVGAASHFSESLFFIDDSSAISPFEIRAKARRLKARHGLDLLIIDYLQLMSLKSQMESREREVSEISRLLKAMAKELNLPVVALSQLNRGVEGRTNRRPLLSDLRESGSIEQDADVIMMLYREEYYNNKSDRKGEAELILNKQRNGPTGVVHLKWNPIYGSFENTIPLDVEVPPPVSHPPTPF